MRKVAFFSLPGLENFVEPIVNGLQNDFETKLITENSLYEVIQNIAWADTVWFEWANEIAWRATQDQQIRPLLQEKHTIVRYHSYELFTGIPERIGWDVIDDVIFVAKHMREEALNHVPPSVTSHIIPNGINLYKFDIGPGKIEHKENNKQIALVGHINHKKGPMLAIHAFHALYKELFVLGQDKYHLHIAGDVQDKRYDHYFAHIVDKLGIGGYVTFHDFIDDVPAFLQDKSHILCSSPWESQNLSIMEGMACGLKPLIHNFPGSEDIYPREHIWNSTDDFLQIVLNGKWKPSEYRHWVRRNYNLETTLAHIKQLLQQGHGSKGKESIATALQVEGESPERRPAV